MLPKEGRKERKKREKGDRLLDVEKEKKFRKQGEENASSKETGDSRKEREG